MENNIVKEYINSIDNCLDKYKSSNGKLLKNIIEGVILGIYESIIILGKLNMISKDDRHKISDYIIKIQDEIKRLETI